VRLNRTTLALATYAAILYAFRSGLERSSLGHALGTHLRFAFASFALLPAPLWFFGFGAGDWLRDHLRAGAVRILLPAVLGSPYIIFATNTGYMNWRVAITMFALPVALAALLELTVKSNHLEWQDVAVLTILVGTYMSHVLSAWGYAGLTVLPKLYIADVALYLYVVVRGLRNMGYSFLPSLSAIAIGLREWLYFLPLGIGIGWLLHFIHFHARLPSGTAAGTAVLATFLLVAIPEELFFRGILQNLLETRLRPWIALLVAAVLFGLGHFNKGAAFNWRYVLLAAIAGIFYGRAWQARRQLLASIITHTAVDVVWSLWFR
jgi:membrane protease YdiL (CAAX protease family)